MYLRYHFFLICDSKNYPTACKWTFHKAHCVSKHGHSSSWTVLTRFLYSSPTILAINVGTCISTHARPLKPELYEIPNKPKIIHHLEKNKPTIPCNERLIILLIAQYSCNRLTNEHQNNCYLNNTTEFYTRQSSCQPRSKIVKIKMVVWDNRTVCHVC